jgi:hypothetical protein
MLTQKIFSYSKSNKGLSNNSEDEQIKKILKEIKSEYKNTIFFEPKSAAKINTFRRNRSILSSTSIGTSYKYSFSNKKSENSLSNKLKDNITKESLILELRQELKHHMKFNYIYNHLLKSVIHLKEVVKQNRDNVQRNSELFIETFKDKYNLIQQYEKTIVSLGEEKKEIKKTNEEIYQLRKDTNDKLIKQMSEIDERNNQQKEKLDSLSFKMKDLEYKRSVLNEELQEQMEKDQKNYEEQLKKFKTLSNGYEYYKDEYNSFLKTGDEMTKINVKLDDDTNAKNELIKEDLEVKLNDKIIQKSFLIGNINRLKLKMKSITDQEKEKSSRYEKRLLASKIISYNKSRIIKNRQAKNIFNKK